MAAKELFNTSLFLDANLKAYYRLNNGVLLTDSSSGGNNLTNNNSVSEILGLFNGGANFGNNNINKSLSVGSDFGINGGTVSVSLWVRFPYNLTNFSQCIFNISDSTTKTRMNISYFYGGGSKYLGFSRVKTEVADQVATYGINLDSSLWYHLVYVYNGSTIYGYVNGTQVTSVSASGNGTSSLSNLFYLGCNLDNSNSPQYYSSIDLDDVAIFNRVLTSTEISNLYNGNYPDRFKKVKTNWFF